MANPRAVLYDSGYPHPIVRMVSLIIALSASILFLDVLLSYFGLDFFKETSHSRRPLALALTTGLAWWCTMCAFARLVICHNPESCLLLFYSQGFFFRIRERSHVAASTIVKLAVRYIQSSGLTGRSEWTVQWIDNAGHFHEILACNVEKECRDAARRIGEAIGKPVE
jgi:hypothetical protein